MFATVDKQSERPTATPLQRIRVHRPPVGSEVASGSATHSGRGCLLIPEATARVVQRLEDEEVYLLAFSISDTDAGVPGSDNRHAV